MGCGPGRNAHYLRRVGFEVDAIDLSLEAIEWARERGSGVNFIHGDMFEAGLTGPYDLVYDSGCLHHLPPHRRVGYLELVGRVLKPGGHLGLVCFAAGAMGSERSDAELYRVGSLEGGLAFTEESLRWIFADFAGVDLRRMREGTGHFGESFLWTALFRR